MRRPLRMVSTLDIASAVAACTSGELTAGQVAQTELRAVHAHDSIETAAWLMST